MYSLNSSSGAINPVVTAVPVALLTSQSSSSMMQMSTDTLVEDPHSESSSKKVQQTNLDVLFETNQKSNAELVKSSESSSTPLSSSIPSLNSSLMFINNNNNNSNIKKVSNINDVSTSTSGLSEYVNSNKFRYINESIKSFEKNFNDPLNSQLKLNEKMSHIRSNLNLENRISNLSLNLNEANGHVENNLSNKRIASSSIPIKMKNVRTRKCFLFI
jgi:hypothetical protein